MLRYSKNHILTNAVVDVNILLKSTSLSLANTHIHFVLRRVVVDVTRHYDSGWAMLQSKLYPRDMPVFTSTYSGGISAGQRLYRFRGFLHARESCCCCCSSCRRHRRRRCRRPAAGKCTYTSNVCQQRCEWIICLSCIANDGRAGSASRGRPL